MLSLQSAGRNQFWHVITGPLACSWVSHNYGFWLVHLIPWLRQSSFSINQRTHAHFPSCSLAAAMILATLGILNKPLANKCSLPLVTDTELLGFKADVYRTSYDTANSLLRPLGHNCELHLTHRRQYLLLLFWTSAILQHMKRYLMLIAPHRKPCVQTKFILDVSGSWQQVGDMVIAACPFK